MFASISTNIRARSRRQKTADTPPDLSSLENSLTWPSSTALGNGKLTRSLSALNLQFSNRWSISSRWIRSPPHLPSKHRLTRTRTPASSISHTTIVKLQFIWWNTSTPPPTPQPSPTSHHPSLSLNTSRFSISPAPFQSPVSKLNLYRSTATPSKISSQTSQSTSPPSVPSTLFHPNPHIPSSVSQSSKQLYWRCATCWSKAVIRERISWNWRAGSRIFRRISICTCCVMARERMFRLWVFRRNFVRSVVLGRRAMGMRLRLSVRDVARRELWSFFEWHIWIRWQKGWCSSVDSLLALPGLLFTFFPTQRLLD